MQMLKLRRELARAWYVCTCMKFRTQHLSCHDLCMYMYVLYTHVSGFHTEGWGPLGFPPPEILKLSMVIIVASMCCLENLS